MISTEIFWTRVAAYNELTWLLQLVLSVTAAVLTYVRMRVLRVRPVAKRRIGG